VSKSGKRPANRREAVARIQAQQKASERRRTLVVLTPAIVLAVVIGVVVYLQVRDQSVRSNSELADIGASADEVCRDVVTKSADGSNDHRDEGSPIDYPQAPPAMGPHWPQFLVGGQIRKFWTAEDRPPVERLVHSLEHGWTIVWYDEEIAADEAAMDDLRAIADKYAGSDPKDKVMVAPWSKEDGSDFPDGARVALTHWSMGGSNDNPEGQQGVWRYCSEVSGEAVDQFVVDYPYSDAPEPGAA
jgi:hypothetical protein